MAFLHLFAVLFVSGLAQGEYSESRIVSGWPAEDGQFPYLVSLRMVRDGGGVGACGGAILNNEWAITAAHCLARRITYVVRLGVTNLTRPDLMFETDVSRARIHPRYNQASTAVQTDDIGLLNFGRIVTFSPNIQPIRLQSSERRDIEYDGVVLTISGFGRNNDAWLGGYVPEILSWVYQRGITQEECFRWYPNSQVISAQTMCAQYYNETSQAPCFGDSGGPLTQVDIDGELTVVGLNSFGPAVGCNSPNAGGFVRPEYYHDWITENTGISFDWSLTKLING